MPLVEEMLMTEPPPLWSIAGIAYFMPRKTPLALISMVRSQSSILVSSTPPRWAMPALLIRMSRRAGGWGVGRLRILHIACGREWRGGKRGVPPPADRLLGPPPPPATPPPAATTPPP